MTDPTDPIKKSLSDCGLSEGAWAEMEERVLTSPLVGKNVEALKKLRSFLEARLAQDQASVVQLREQLNRIRFGGGS